MNILRYVFLNRNFFSGGVVVHINLVQNFWGTTLSPQITSIKSNPNDDIRMIQQFTHYSAHINVLAPFSRHHVHVKLW